MSDITGLNCPRCNKELQMCSCPLHGITEICREWQTRALTAEGKLERIAEYIKDVSIKDHYVDETYIEQIIKGEA